ncbi:MAG TPA: methyltransferase [Polyangiaceae bacterium]|nr:methyltransferase [Polyangiaceae bacterium]
MDPQETARSLREELGLSLRYALDPSPTERTRLPILQLGPDAALVEYAAHARRARHGRLKTWLHRSLRGFLSDFDINGWLGTYPMHVLSRAQFAELLGDGARGRLLDIGSGRGDVTSELASHFQHVTCTETSPPMARRLRRAGYRVLEGDFATFPPSDERYDVVSLLNVLDRCDRPLSLLGAAREALTPGGRLLLALVLPYQPFVYDGGRSRAPRERLPIASDRFESALLELVDYALLPLGLEVESVARVPYLSGGDAQRPLYELDDALVVCRAAYSVPVLG